MADIKTINVNGATYVGSAPDTDIVTAITDSSVVTAVTTPTVSSAVPATTVNVLLNGLGEENIPDPRLFKFLSDKFKVNEEALRAVFKVLQDSGNTAEASSRAVRKVLADSLHNTEAITKVWNIIRSYLDTVHSSELLKQDVRKALTDVAHKSDVVSKTGSKALVDAIHMADLSYATILVSSGKFEQLFATDVLSTLIDFKRSFSDIVVTTDDFYGSANVDDDEYAFVYKVLSDWASTSDVSKVTFSKSPILDTVVKTDQTKLKPQLYKLDTSTAQDIPPQFGYAKTTLEVVSGTETVQSDVLSVQQDIANTVDEFSNAVDKIADSDNVSNTDDYQILDTIKVVIDPVNVTEGNLFDINTVYADIAESTDRAILEIGKLATETLSFTDVLLGKQIGVGISEYDYFLSDYALEDYSVRAVHLADKITNITVNKGVTDLVDATDDFYGAANIDDDQYVAVSKKLTETQTLTETFSRLVLFNRIFTDTATKTDVLDARVAKVLADTANKADTIYKQISPVLNPDQSIVADSTKYSTRKGLLDVAVTSEERTALTAKKVANEITNTVETTSAALSTVYSNIAAISETFIRVFEAYRSFENTVSNADNALLKPNKNVLETVAQQPQLEVYLTSVGKKALETVSSQHENFYGTTSKILLDAVDATDDFYGAATVGDDETAKVTKVVIESTSIGDVFTRIVQYIRSLLDSLHISELVVLTANKVLADSVQKTDTVTKTGAKVINDTASTSQLISLNRQNYFSSNYAVVGYAGDSYSY